ncbi:hypothetical protein [Sphingobacterium siyangense]|uniref:hypothetical protein n=1 Tax=Sphingobacterium siyangense TaxID=459529 RepID=UPI00301A51B7
MKNLEKLNEVEVLNEQEIKTIKGGLVAGSTVESEHHDSDTTQPTEPEEAIS